ncbi:MAG: hypothetical protein COB24_14075 [Hyphomicrobiales bacterium]|nr:MAG: hypothetical protein COB24_14075 [Hyphomicrobiales bacterium]
MPAPYHNMYSAEDIIPVVRTQDEYDNAHPFLKAFMNSPISKSFSTEETRNAVIPAYMGLIKQADDQMGVLFDWFEKTDRMKDTMIVITSDHGDFLGDHWMGEKSFFYNSSIKIPLIIYDPSKEADATRGTVCDALIETIDLAPTEERRQFLENNSLVIDETTGEKTSMITGCFRFTSPESHLLLEHLPTILHMKDQDRLNNAWPCPLLQIISNEITLNQVGSAVIIDRLIETLFIYSLRYYFLSDNNVSLPSWLSALNDKNIGKSLQLMHANLAHSWSLQSLADKVGMSRSSFSQKFKQSVGRTPVEHLTQWRMVHAGALIRQEKNMKLISIAQAVGYESESAFRKTFTKTMGQTPKRYKLRH